MPLLHHQSTEWAVCDQLSLVFFPIIFPSAPYWMLYDFVPHLRDWAGRFNQIMDHMDLEHLKYVTHIVVVTEPPVTLSKSIQVAPYIQILKLGKGPLIANPICWLCALWTKSRTQRLWDRQRKVLVDQSCSERRVSWASVSSWPFRSTGPHTSSMGWGHTSILGNTVIFLRAETVAWSLQSTSALVPK